jgi:SAM-dependent methyltransferase
MAQLSPTPDDDISRQRDHFESVAADYIRGRESPNHLIFKERMWSDFFTGTEVLFPKRRVRLLEAMCGYSEGKALFAKYISDQFDYTGFDYSETMVAHAKKHHPNDHIFLQDVMTFQTEEKFDMIILLSGLHHVYRHTETVLRRLRESLVPGGLFLSLEPTSNNPLMKFAGDMIYLRHRFFDAETEKRYTLSELNSAFNASGFSVVKQTFPGLLPYTLYYNPGIFPWLDKGSPGFARWLSDVERPLWSKSVGRIFSFATISLCQNPG